MRDYRPTMSVLCLLTLLIGITCLCPGIQKSIEPETMGISSSKMSELNRMIQQHIDRGELAGVVTLIARHGKAAQLKAYGYKDSAAKIPTQTDALFRIASMNKILTSAAALKLYEQGRFQLDDPISKYLPAWKTPQVLESNPAKGKVPIPLKTVPPIREITVRDLFRHTAGFVYAYADTPLDERYRQAGFLTWNKSLQQFVQRLSQLPLAYQPGQRWEYSYSIDVLGYLIEVVSGQPLHRFMKEKVFLPLGMKDTDYYVPQEKWDRLMNDYQFKEGSLSVVEPSTQEDFRSLPAGLSGGGGWKTGYGGVVTTAADLGRFLQMILNHGELDGIRLLRAETIALMVSNQIADISDRGFPVSGYGLGTGVEPDKNNPQATKLIYWAGGPYNTYYYVDLQREMYGIFLTQTAPFQHLGIMTKFRNLAQACAID